ncbi:MAG: DUF2169 domain-containing protein [Deltaproteobacteria bacterium]|nr:DUF2169 domain-containing protein [Deltaproteobacteria bacterium]
MEYSPRREAQVHILRDTPFALAPFVWSLRPPRPSLTLVLKATYRIPERGGACTLADEQPPCEGERFHDADPTASLRFDSDFAVLKPRGEWILAGTCHAPRGKPATEVLVRIAVGKSEKSIAVLGDRTWTRKMLGDAMSARAPFTSMPLRPERAFGGPAIAANPLGMGAPRRTSGGAAAQKVALPNLELPSSLVHSPSDTPAPAMTTPRGATWPDRIALAGTYDASWRRTRWPWFPSDFDAGYFNSAPRDQQIDRYWRGDEPIVLGGLHPTRANIKARLPGDRARAFLLEHDVPVEESRAAGRVREVRLNLDTIAIDADALLVHCVWRGVTEVASSDLDTIEAVLAVHEPIGDTRPTDVYAARLPVVAREQGVTLSLHEPRPAAPDARGVAAGTPARSGAAALDARSARLGSPDRAPAATERALGPNARVAELAAIVGNARLVAHRPIDPQRASRGRALVESRLRDGAALRGMDLTGADLSELDLTRVDLGGAILTDANLSRARLERTRLADATLVRANLDGALAQRCDLTRACLDDARLAGADLRFACLVRASAVGAALDGARLDDALLDDADLHDASIAGASWVGAYASRTDLSGARCDAADFTHAVLRDATLSDAHGAAVVLDGADLTGLRAAGHTVLERARLRRVVADGSRWAGARLEGADFSGARLARADFGGAYVSGARFDCADLRDARFGGATLVGASMLGANAMHAVLESADLSRADVRGASFFEAELHQARTDGWRTEATDLTGTKAAGH